MKQLFAFGTLRSAFSDIVEPENMRLIVVSFWRFLMVVLVLITAATLWNGYASFQTASAVFDAYVPTTTSKAPFSKSGLDASVAVFGNRAALYQTLVASPITDTDPSK